MIRIKRILLLVCAFALFAPLAKPTRGAAKHPITFDDLVRMERITEAQVSPDGKWVAYKVVTPDRAANRNASDIWVVSTAGGEPRQLTRSGHDSQPHWSPDSKHLAFISDREGAAQVYRIALDGGEATRLTSLSGEADNVQWSPNGQLISFTSNVYPDCRDDACNRDRDAAREKSKVKARIYEHLLYRHWKTWSDGKRSHLFVVPSEAGAPRDLTPGADYDVPPVQRGDVQDIAFSSDSKELSFVAVTDKMEATSTNGDLFVVPVSGGEPRRITTNAGFDSHPAYSPDGRAIAYRSQARAGNESDLWRLMLYDRQTGRHMRLAEKFDRSVETILWSPDGKTIYFDAEDSGQKPIFAVAAQPGAEPKAILPNAFTAELSLSRDGRTLVFTRSSFVLPAEIFAANPDGSNARQLTHHNAACLAVLDLNPAEHFWFEGAEGTRVHAMLVRPPTFDPAKKYPLLLIPHGGPETQWSDNWGYRWNPQMFAAPGYVALLINRRGSTGFGQKFTDEIRDDWGGRAYLDLMKGVDYVVEKYPFVDGARIGAAGASYGGFMINWIATHTGRFKVLVSHAGGFDEISSYGATEELWFPEWEFRGTPWSNPESYRKWSISAYAGALGKFKTPTLVTHGEQDYRVPYTEGLQMFTALQREGVPSKLLLFPDEGHWILKPQNSELWYKTVLDWLANYLK